MIIRKDRNVVTFVSAIIIGLFAHGYVLTHNLILHDNTYNFYLGGTYSLGRWMLEIIGRVTNLVNDNYLHFASPLFLGGLSIVYIALAGVILVNILDIKREISCIAIAGIMVSFPMVTSLFGYMFTSASYMFGLVLALAGVFFAVKTEKWYNPVIGTVLMACAAGVYQAFIASFVSVMLLFFLREIIEGRGKGKFLWYLKRMGIYAGELIGALLVYLGVMKLFLWHYHTELADYQGLSSMADTGLSQYLERIGNAYREFFVPPAGIMRNMYQGGALKMYYIILAVMAVLVILEAVRIFRQSRTEGILLLAMVALLPLAVNFIYVICDENIHSVMMFSEVFTFVFVMMLADRIPLSKKKPSELARLIPGVCVLFLVVLNCRFSNICYLRGEYIQNQATNYFTRMVARIESTPGYKADLPVAFANYAPVPDKNVFVYPEFTGTVNIIPFSIKTVIDNYSWPTFMTVQCGYNPEIVDIETVNDRDAVDKMSCYPDDGSIRIIDGVIVVKFSND